MTHGIVTQAGNHGNPILTTVGVTYTVMMDVLPIQRPTVLSNFHYPRFYPHCLIHLVSAAASPFRVTLQILTHYQAPPCQQLRYQTSPILEQTVIHRMIHFLHLKTVTTLIESGDVRIRDLLVSDLTLTPVRTDHFWMHTPVLE